MLASASCGSSLLTVSSQSLSVCTFASAEVRNADVHILAKLFSDDEYDDSTTRKSNSRKKKGGVHSQSTNSLSFLSGFLQNQRQLGGTLVGVGFLLSFLGIMLFFEGNLLRFGNILIISGVPLLIGPNTVRRFFMDRTRLQATIITALGIFLVLIGKPRLGIMLEIFGLLNLFGNMMPLVLAIVKRLPVVGDIIAAFEGKGATAGGLGVAEAVGGSRQRRGSFDYYAPPEDERSASSDYYSRENGRGEDEVETGDLYGATDNVPRTLGGRGAGERRGAQSRSPGDRKRKGGNYNSDKLF